MLLEKKVWKPWNQKPTNQALPALFILEKKMAY